LAITLTNYFKDALLTNELAASGAGTLYGARVALRTDGVSPNADMVFADITQPISSSYAIQTITWDGPSDRVDGSFESVSQLLTYQFADALANPNTITGYVVLGATSSNHVLWGENLPTPVGLNDPTDALRMAVNICYGSGDYGEVSVLS